MLTETDVSTDRKRKFGTDIGGDLHLASPDGTEQQEELSSHSGHEQVASKWDKSVVSLAPFDEGDSIHPACTGIVFDHTNRRALLMTSLSMFRSGDAGRMINYNMTIKVRLPDNQVVDGLLMSHDSTHNLAVVSVLPEAGCVRAACLDHQQQIEPHSQVVALRRCFSSGKLMAAARMMLGSDPLSSYREEAAVEGLLVDSLGNFAGLNCYAQEGSSHFIPRSTILEFVAEFQKAWAEKYALRTPCNFELHIVSSCL